MGVRKERAKIEMDAVRVPGSNGGKIVGDLGLIAPFWKVLCGGIGGSKRGWEEEEKERR